MKRQLIGIRAHSTGEYRTEELLGKEYLVIPVIALVEGVIQGMTAEGPELALAEEFGRFPAGWDGRPVVMSHPQKDGVPVSANSPDILADYQIGVLYNTVLEGKKLHQEAWIEVNRASDLNTNSKNILAALKKGEIIEVSTGYFAQIEETSGTFERDNGESEEYIAIQRNVVPDHLAFLPIGATGACSVEMGCGAPRINQKMQADLRVNCADCGGTCPETHTMPAALTTPTPTPENNDQYATVEDYEYTVIENGKMVKKKKKTAKNPEAYSANSKKQVFGSVVDMQAFKSVILNSFPDNMLDYDAEKLVAAALRKEQSYTYVIGLTSAKVVYEQYDPMSSQYKTFSRSYNVASDGKVTLGSDAQEIVLMTQILPVVNESNPVVNSDDHQPGGSGTMPATTTAAAPAPQDPNSAVTTNGDPKPTEPKTFKSSNDQGDITVVMNADNSIKSFEFQPKAPVTPAVNAAPQTLEQLLANAPASLKGGIERAMKMHDQHKASLIKGILETKRSNFNEEQLKAFDVDMLENLSQLAQVPRYDGVAPPSADLSANSSTPAPLVFEAPKLVVDNNAK
jgi:hypothetical protein